MGSDGKTRRRASLRVAWSDAHGRSLPGSLPRWLAQVAPVRARGTVNVALVSDGSIRTLNRRYRGIDRTTDVLSFPAESFPQASSSSRVPSFLGDIVIARGVAKRQARAAGHPEATELKVLALHGLLHLLGYDHEHDAGTMARVERRLRRKGGLPAGLIERR
jgi:probable rRNA maturation factor